MGLPCIYSRVYDVDLNIEIADGVGGPISLCDRVPAGKYAIVDSGLNASEAVSRLFSYGFRGAVFYLGNSDETPSKENIVAGNSPTSIRDSVYFSPSSSSGYPWQKYQYQLLEGQLSRRPNSLSEISGYQPARQLRIVTGGYFKCGQGAFKYPRTNGEQIAAIKNKLNLDFVMVDVSDQAIWNQAGAGERLLTLATAFHGNTTRNPESLLSTRLSQHCPLFIITGNSVDNYPNMLASDGVCEVFVNGFTGPKTFPAPRVVSGSGLTSVQNIWQWARPADSLGATASSSQMVIDIKNQVDPSAEIGYATDENIYGGLTIYWPVTGTGSWRSVNSGMIVYDNIDMLVNPSLRNGRAPTTYWDYDRREPIYGTLVPSWHPDPPPPARANTEYYNHTYGGLLLEVENWKIGHTDPTNIPNLITIKDPNCAGSRSPIRNWLRFDGFIPLTIGLSDTFYHYLSGNITVFTGHPQQRDVGIHPLLIEMRGHQRETSEGLGYSNWTQFMTVITVTDPNSEIGVLTTPAPYTDNDSASNIASLRSRVSEGHRLPYDWFDPTIWCKGADTALQFPNLPRVTTAPPTVSSSCGNYYPEVILSCLDGCLNFGSNTPQSICSTWQDITEYAGFVYSVIHTVSAWNPLHWSSLGKGLFSIPTYTVLPSQVGDLASIGFSTDVAHFNLEIAWEDARNAPCYGLTYEQRVRHAMTAYLELSKIFPGAHGGNVDTSLQANHPWHISMGCDVIGGVAGVEAFTLAASQIAPCFRDYVNAGGLPALGGAGGSTDGRVAPGGAISICQAKEYLRAATYGSYPKLTEEEITIAVSIALAENGGTLYTDQVNVNGPDSTAPGSKDIGVMQWNDYWHPEISYSCTVDPACAFNEVLRVVRTNGRSDPWYEWSTYFGKYNSHLEYINIVRNARCEGYPNGIVGCPCAGRMSDDCTAHLNRPSTVALDISNVAETPLYSLCNGTITYFGWDERYFLYGDVSQRPTHKLQDDYAPPITGDCQYEGVNYPCYKGILVRVACDGGVYEVEYGHMSYSTLYNLDLPQEGAHVNAQQQIGRMGTTGFSTGTHLHIEIAANGTKVCPTDLINTALCFST